MRAKVFERRNWAFQRRWYFHVKADNGEIVANSEAYNSRQSAVNTLRLLKGLNEWHVDVEGDPPFYPPIDPTIIATD